MRNLKKVLSLTLALVMMLSMMTFAGAAETTKVSTATDLTDMKDVTNKEAVTLLVDLKVIAGRDNGAFDPAGSLKRAEFAKLIYVAKAGDDDKATNFVGAATGLTDVAGTWFEGYVNYAYSTGIVSGTSKTTFTPNGLVKVAEAAKMLLVGLGYDAKAEGYTDNALWSVNVMQQAKQTGLLDGVKLGANVALTRDAAAQMVFNALMAKTVSVTYGFDMNGKKYITGATIDKTTWGEEVFDLQKVEGVVTGITEKGKAMIDGSVSSLATTPDVIGCKVVYYRNSSTGKLISTALLASQSTVLATSTDGTSIANLSNSAKAAYVATKDEAGLTYYVNGVKVADHAGAGDYYWLDGGVLKYNAAVTIANGVIVELIDNDSNNKFDVVRVTVKTFDTVEEKGVTITKSTTLDKVDSLSIDGVAGIQNQIAANVFGYEGLKEGDVILYVKIGGRTYIEKTATVTGSIAASKSVDGAPLYLLGGTYYGVSGLAGAASPVNALLGANYNKDVTLYLDNNKTIVVAVLNEKAATKHAVLLDIVYVGNIGAGSVGGHAEALMLYPDGTTAIVNVNKIDGATVVFADGSTTAVGDLPAHGGWHKKASEAADTNKVGTVLDTDSGVFLAAGEFVSTYDVSTWAVNKSLATYVGISDKTATKAREGKIVTFTETSTKGTVELTTVANIALTDAAYATGQTVIGGGANLGVTKLIVDEKTTFLVRSVKDGKFVYNKYDGLAKLPGMTKIGATPDFAQAIATAGDIATLVYMPGAVPSAALTTPDSAYITNDAVVSYTSKTATTAEYWEFAAIFNGKITTVKVNAAAKNAITTNHEGLYQLELEEGIATSANIKMDGDANLKSLEKVTGTIQTSNGIIGLKTTPVQYYTYTKDAKVFFINSNTNNVTVGTMTDVVSDNDDDAVGIVEKITGAKGAEATTLTTLYITVNGANAGTNGEDNTVYAVNYTVAPTATTNAGKKVITVAPVMDDLGAANENALDGSMAMNLQFFNTATGKYETIASQTAVIENGVIKDGTNSTFTVAAKGTYRVEYTFTITNGANKTGVTMPCTVDDLT